MITKDRMVRPKSDIKQGWICPKCGKVNSPFVLGCDHKCNPDLRLIENNGEEHGKH